MNEFEPEQLPPDLADLGEHLRDSRPHADFETLDRVMTRAQGANTAPRKSLLWRSDQPRLSRRTLAGAVAALVVMVGVVGTASGFTITLAASTVAAVRTVLHVGATGTITIDSGAATTQYNAACANELNKLGILQRNPVANATRILAVNANVIALCNTVKVVSATPAAVAFGSVSRHSSASVIVTVKNVGGGTAIVMGASSILGGPGSQFTVTSDGCTGKTLPFHATCFVKVTFKKAPTLGTFTDTLSILSGASNSPTLVPLSATRTV